MNFSRTWGGIFSLLILVLPVSHRRSGQSAWTLPQVLNRMDQSARSFRTLTAQVQRTKVTVVVNDHSTETGAIYVERDGKMRLNIVQPDPRTVLRLGDRLYLYNPLLHQVEEYDLSKHREVVEQFLLLGFGTPTRELERAYEIRFGGEQTIDNRKTILLNLTPKSQAIRNQISQIQLWVDESNWLPFKQRFQETGTPDYFVIRYSDIVRNANLKRALFRPNWPKGTQKIKPGS
ncbi:MAG TPA: outer-membrane lipoprotein carrier protein LolA [Candidatus Dormibacteraeota bacterium]|nr:outer-membrane lipoprotein carrier protein LolA [Candidatus Dormibacteraeota bacterium]